VESGRFELQWASSRFHSFTLFLSEPGGYNPEVAFTSHKMWWSERESNPASGMFASPALLLSLRRITGVPVISSPHVKSAAEEL